MRTLEEVRQFLARDAFAFDVCGITIDEVGDGAAKASMPLRPMHLNANGVAQGGAIFTLVDICFAAAANTGEVMTVAQNADIHYLRPGTGGCLYAEAQRVYEGRTTALYRVDVYDDRQKQVASASVTGFHVQPPVTAS